MDGTERCSFWLNIWNCLFKIWMRRKRGSEFEEWRGKAGWLRFRLPLDLYMALEKIMMAKKYSCLSDVIAEALKEFLEKYVER